MEPEDVRVTGGPPGDFVQSLARGLAVIRAFDADNPVLTLSEVARRSQMSRAAAGRFLRTLQTLGYVRADGVGRGFMLTPRVLELGFSYLSAQSLPEIIHPHLELLSRELDESVSAAVLDGAEIVYIARVPTRRIMSVRISIGTRFPAYSTALGRVLLAAGSVAETDAAVKRHAPTTATEHARKYVDAVHAEIAVAKLQGWALVDGELEPGLRSVAAPIHAQDGTVVAAVNVATSTSRETVDRLRNDLLPRLLKTTHAIDADLRLLPANGSNGARFRTSRHFCFEEA